MRSGSPEATSPGDASRLEPADVAPVESQVVLNGVVRRSRGPDVVWVNGGGPARPDSRIRLRQGPDPSNRVTLEDAADGNSVAPQAGPVLGAGDRARGQLLRLRMPRRRPQDVAPGTGGGHGRQAVNAAPCVTRRRPAPTAASAAPHC